ncbi:protein LTO1 homolog isoform X4 [Pteropus medius]|uniref:protein LTO1 homolog isoform X4 n=1 Tax=Pteropus vampyrus TaxID=132908 RepID=UPI00196B8EB4|nr:protein LTO1 homolog isoform X4 [Pteropus giganteus]
MAGGQDLFDAIVMADDRFHGQGYQEGYEEGSSLGIIEGRQHGTLHGAKIGSEVGCYQGFAFAWRGLLRSHATGKDRWTKATCIIDRIGDPGLRDSPSGLSFWILLQLFPTLRLHSPGVAKQTNKQTNKNDHKLGGLTTEMLSLAVLGV